MYTLSSIVWAAFAGSEGDLCPLAGTTPPLNIRSAPSFLWATPSRLALSASSFQIVQTAQFILTGPLWEGWRHG